jgi:hypothetical protein
LKKLLVMNVPFDWDKYEDDFKRKVFKDTKSGSIAFIKDIDKIKNWNICLGHWETFLTSNYWKDWQKR